MSPSWACYFLVRNVSICPLWIGMKEFLVIPSHPNTLNQPKSFKYVVSNSNSSDSSNSNTISGSLSVFAAKRDVTYYNNYYQSAKNIHFISKPGLGYRLLEHFYTFLYFEDIYMVRQINTIYIYTKLVKE